MSLYEGVFLTLLTFLSIFIHMLTTLTLYADCKIAQPFVFDGPPSAGFQGS